MINTNKKHDIKNSTTMPSKKTTKSKNKKNNQKNRNNKKKYKSAVLSPKYNRFSRIMMIYCKIEVFLRLKVHAKLLKEWLKVGKNSKLVNITGNQKKRVGKIMMLADLHIFHPFHLFQGKKV